ncbi:SUR7 family fmp45 [Hyphodiscus hymeniophilus]|uniref:SUR7 family fmp45 n=1 Tax=Hyphodiscus hymeniophilus TaxID=353542 RepID=A0A9P6VMS1_9HELO|nr:SUR7 family fmp45 [Hyphodiscus hymeniophilus]
MANRTTDKFSSGAPLGLTSLILIAGSIVLLFFVVLSGVSNSIPLNKTYFMRADTSTIAGARATSQWTYFYVCGEGNTNCGKPVPDLPIGYAWIGGTAGVPESLVGGFGKHTTSKYYYYMWRFGWVFYLLALIFDVLGFFAALLAPCSRLASGLSGLIMMAALFFLSLGASLMTAVFVKAVKQFKDAGMDAKIGEYALGFTWGAWAAIFLATCLLFLGCGLGGRKDTTSTTTRTSGKGNVGFFRRQRSTKSARGSIGYDNESQRRVKEEY